MNGADCVVLTYLFLAEPSDASELLKKLLEVRIGKSDANRLSVPEMAGLWFPGARYFGG